MDSVLSTIRPRIEKYIKMIRAIFDVDVDVCDRQLVRVAGTGANNRMIGKRLASGRHSQKAMNEKTYVIAKDPLNEEMCQGCVNQNICIRHCGMTFPLMNDDEVFGAINITALNSEQEKELIERQEDFVLFMQTICDLITLTVREHQNFRIQSYNMKLQERLINVINDGVMILNEHNAIQFINERCSKILGYNLQQIQYLTRIKQLSVRPLKIQDNEQIQCEVVIRDTRLRLTGRCYDVETLAPGKTDKIFVFFDIRTLHENMNPAPGFSRFTFHSLIGESPLFRETVSLCKNVACTLSPILLSGEAGTGKELFARAIHNESTLCKNQFIEIIRSNAMQDFIETSILGSDPAAINELSLKNDIIEGNSLYFNEISNLSMENQQILLRIINTGHFLNSRVICSTSRPLKPLVESGDFYPELFYVLDVNSILIPPLRSRGKDIILFAEHFIKSANKRAHKNIRLSKEVYGKFLDYLWPGNIREIENTITYIVDHSEIDDGELGAEQLPAAIKNKLEVNRNMDYNLENAEKQLIIKALNELAYNTNSKALVAKELGISTATLYRKLSKYGIVQNPIFR